MLGCWRNLNMIAMDLKVVWELSVIHFHNIRHQFEMAESETNAFPTHLIIEEEVIPDSEVGAFLAT